MNILWRTFLITLIIFNDYQDRSGSGKLNVALGYSEEYV